MRTGTGNVNFYSLLAFEWAFDSRKKLNTSIEYTGAEQITDAYIDCWREIEKALAERYPVEEFPSLPSVIENAVLGGLVDASIFFYGPADYKTRNMAPKLCACRFTPMVSAEHQKLLKHIEDLVDDCSGYVDSHETAAAQAQTPEPKAESIKLMEMYAERRNLFLRLHAYVKSEHFTAFLASN
jgi:hypothetical protein